jgi:hypothetical protein
VVISGEKQAAHGVMYICGQFFQRLTNYAEIAKCDGIYLHQG